MGPRTPVLVGVGQINHDHPGTEEPVDLLAEAAKAAAKDAGVPGVLDAVDSVRVVRILSRKYSDPAALVCQRLKLGRGETVCSEVGGDSPQLLVNRAAADIAAGSCDVALVGGAEAWRSRMAAKRAGTDLGWTIQPKDQKPTRVLGTELVDSPEDERVGLVTPSHQYPLFEIALRAARGEAVNAHRTRVGRLWEGFSAVAAGNPFAAIRRAVTAKEITTPGPKNRMIGFPYTKLMNANNNVDQAAAVLVCSVERARALGIPSDRWVFLHAAAERVPYFVQRYALRCQAGRNSLMINKTSCRVIHRTTYGTRVPSRFSEPDEVLATTGEPTVRSYTVSGAFKNLAIDLDST